MSFNNSIDKSNWPSPESLVERKNGGESWTKIAKSLNCSRKVVQLYVAIEQSCGCTPNQRNITIERDNAFVALMTKAIAEGCEKATIGISVDTSYTSAPMMHPIPAPYSGCGSPSEMCMDAGGNDDVEVGYEWTFGRLR
jgi:hypothetical protein